MLGESTSICSGKGLSARLQSKCIFPARLDETLFERCDIGVNAGVSIGSDCEGSQAS